MLLSDHHSSHESSISPLLLRFPVSMHVYCSRPYPKNRTALPALLLSRFAPYFFSLTCSKTYQKCHRSQSLLPFSLHPVRFRSSPLRSDSSKACDLCGAKPHGHFSLLLSPLNSQHRRAIVPLFKPLSSLGTGDVHFLGLLLCQRPLPFWFLSGLNL